MAERWDDARLFIATAVVGLIGFASMVATVVGQDVRNVGGVVEKFTGARPPVPG
jgi:hypothetical protein